MSEIGFVSGVVGICACGNLAPFLLLASGTYTRLCIPCAENLQSQIVAAMVKREGKEGA